MHSENLLSHRRCSPRPPEVEETGAGGPDDCNRLADSEQTAALPSDGRYISARYAGLGAIESRRHGTHTERSRMGKRGVHGPGRGRLGYLMGIFGASPRDFLSVSGSVA